MNLALFDFDGTVTFQHTFTPFIYFATSRTRIALGAALHGPMILGYKLGLIAAPRMRAAIAWVAFSAGGYRGQVVSPQTGLVSLASTGSEQAQAASVSSSRRNWRPATTS